MALVMMGGGLFGAAAEQCRVFFVLVEGVVSRSRSPGLRRKGSRSDFLFYEFSETLVCSGEASSYITTLWQILQTA